MKYVTRPMTGLVALSLLLVGHAASASDPVQAGCVVHATTDPLNNSAHYEITNGLFAGLPDVTAFTITCWLQTAEPLGSTELANTRHTCTGGLPEFSGACVNPVVFQTSGPRANLIYACAHLEWSDTGSGATARHHTRTFDAMPSTIGTQCAEVTVDPQSYQRVSFIGWGLYEGNDV